jgi:hypothetical protein
MNYRVLGLVTATALALAGCGPPAVNQITLQEKLLPHPNPTNHVFDASVSDVKTAIKKGFAKWEDEQLKSNRNRVWKGGGDAEAKRLLTLALQLPPGMLFWKGDADSLAKDLLTKPGNENDAYFYGTDSPVGESQVYFKDGQPLIYYTDFHIHLTALGPKRSRVEICTYDSSVVSGVEQRWAPHGTSFIRVNVDPTTVEEYQILLRIGEQLGVKDMLPLATATADSPARQLTKPRGR